MKKATMGCAALLMLGACVPPSANNSPKNAAADAAADRIMANADDTANAADLAAEAAKPAETAGPGWSYSTSEDKMRGATGRTATLASTDTLSLGFPYGETTPELTIRQDPKFGFDIYFTSEGQPQCDDYSNPTVSVKFDNEPVREWGCNRAADGSPGIVFFDSEKTLLAKLKTAKTMMVEVNYYDAGRQQFSFPVAGLKWE